MKRKDIRPATDEEKYGVYEEVDRLYHQGNAVTVKEHRSGFPAVTLDCGELRYLTDCLSLEEWVRKHQSAHQSQDDQKEGEPNGQAG